MNRTALVFDVETTGLPDWTQPADADGQPRMLALAAALVTSDGKTVDHYSALIKPDGFEVDEEGEAFAVNGLTSEKLNAEGVPVVEVLTAYDQLLDSCDFVAAFSIRFDQKMVRAEQRRADRDDRYGYRDTFEIMYKARKVACERGGPHSNPRKLNECYENIIGEELVDHHDVGADLDATVAIYRHLLIAGLVEPKQQVSKR